MDLFQDIETALRDKLGKTVKFFTEKVAGIRTDIISPDLLNNVMVNQDGHKMPVKNLGTVTVNQSNRTLKVSSWDPATVSLIKNAILDANLGLNPINQDGALLVPVPPLTQETRQKFAKLLHEFVNDSKVSMRNVRHDAMAKIKQLEKDKEISKDQKATEDKKVDKIVKEFDEELKKLATSKEKEILG